MLYLVKHIDKIRDKSSLPILIDYLLTNRPQTNDENYEKLLEIRIQIVKTITKFKDASTVRPLMYCMNDKNEHYKMRLCCAEALGRIGDKYAVMPLIDIVKDDNEKSVYVQESAVVALGMLNDIRAIEPLVDILETKQGFIGKFTFLKERIIEAIGKFNYSNEKVFKALKDSLYDESPQIRINAIEALMNSDDIRAFELIKRMLKDENEEVQKNAVIALYNIDGRGILDNILKDEEYSEFVKQTAKEIIDEYEDDEE